MPENSPSFGSPVLAEHRENAPTGWPEVQDGVASSTGLSVLLVNGHQPPAIVVSNNNSICRAFQSSPKLVKLCDPYCGNAHRKAMEAGTTVEYKCHAGLHCVVTPIEIEGRAKLAVIGGRAFVRSEDYQSLISRFRTGDLQALASDELFTNIIFADRQRIRDFAARVEKAARRFRPIIVAKGTEKGATVLPLPVPGAAVVKVQSDQTLQLEIERLRTELEHRSRFADSLQHFLERISSNDPTQTYQSIISSSKDLLNSERASLLIFDENSNELILKAAIGLATDPTTVSPIRLGEGVSGEVIESGKALMVEDVDLSGLMPAPAERRYKTKSFISYPISIAGRKIGVLNVTDKSGGGVYDEVDLSLLDIIGPQVALALERAEWQERAIEFQLMSITDPLTGLPNRRYLEERLTEELNRSKRYDYPMSFLMIDIDDFKSYNDNNGHQAGDLALQITGHCLKAALRSADIASRYGGEEFCILLPQTSVAEAGVIADRIRHRVSTTHFPHGKSQPLGRVTISIGVATYSTIVNSAETVIAAADRALYQAKSLGKDRVEFYRD
ncbi:MAG TPA: diguanylate cyclase [Pyrinomonadaceae bacterium]|nr:diguanylate cyclase [Pyrinomonadaceae bacterium]